MNYAEVEAMMMNLHAVARQINKSILKICSETHRNISEIFECALHHQMRLWSTALNNTIYICIEKKLLYRDDLPITAMITDEFFKEKTTLLRRESLKYLGAALLSVCEEYHNKYNTSCDKKHKINELIELCNVHHSNHIHDFLHNYYMLCKHDSFDLQETAFVYDVVLRAFKYIVTPSFNPAEFFNVFIRNIIWEITFRIQSICDVNKDIMDKLRQYQSEIINNLPNVENATASQKENERVQKLPKKIQKKIGVAANSLDEII